MNAKLISWLLAVRRSSPFFARSQLGVVPNVSWGLLPWEADLLVLSKSKFLTEIEIKISMSDWKADLLKAKHKISDSADYPAVNSIKRFFYAGPDKLMQRHSELGLPESVGIISVDENKIKIIKPALNRSAKKLADKETIQFLRLGTLKAWKMAHDPNLDTFIVSEEEVS